MDRMDIESSLKTFRIIVDTREQNTPASKQRIEAMDAPIERATLNYCDYAANITLPDGNALHSISGRISPACAIERKMSLDELAGCLTRDRARFRREFERARDSGSKVYLLVEDATWEGIMNHRYRSKFTPKAFLASLTAWMVRYDFKIVFCKSLTSGQMIKEILYRDIKERLENGEYG